MKKRFAVPALMVTSALSLSLLAGCGDSNTNNSASSNTSSTNAASTNDSSTNTASTNTASNNASTDTSTNTTTSALEGKVVMWSMWSETEPQAAVIKQAVEDFKAANPNVDLEVKFQGRDEFKLIKPALDGGEAIDIWEGDPSNMINTTKDHVLKLDDLLTQPAIGMDKSVQDSLLPSLMNWTKSLSTQAGLEEGFYALPQQPFAVEFFYNKSVWDKAGVTQAPKTWDEFMAAADLIKKSGSAPVTFDDAYRDQFIGGYLASAMGSDWVDQLVKDKTGDMWKDPIVLQFAKDVQAMREKGFFSDKIAGSKYPAAQQDLVLGQSATYLNGTWLPNEVSKTAGPDFQWGAFQFPTVANGNDKGGQQNLVFGAQGILMNKDSKNIPAAYEFVKYLVSKKTQEGMVKQAVAIPATIDTDWPAQLADAQTAFNNAQVNMPWGFGIDNGGDFSSGTIIPVFMELITGKLSAEQYVDKMVSESKKFYTGK
ncbi:ABC transporter substrate-binding protein [Paenibacillus sp. OV219]|uniref:ABC transporter substrate-binding protein n=1 Tax=Paenibacillus sp. OV219 TaxID=1884377 RepID=UPI0008B2F677|nr:ABC transporter substrate-binding protein [Paenibacillus sp. OV219]SEO89914.1 raffinose/stachyose/melibiose transport system substrate-binding protein [Paenibacillus sp. OV219]